MYKKAPKGWLKHLDFIIIDSVCLQIAFLLGYWARHGIKSPYKHAAYGSMAIMLILFNLFVGFFGESYKNILKRGHYKELIRTIIHMVYVLLIASFYLFIQKEGSTYSRSSMLWMFVFFLVIAYPVRMLRKHYLLSRRNVKTGKKSMLIVTTQERVEEVISNIEKHNYMGWMVTGLVLLDGSRIGETICDIPVVADSSNVSDYICQEWVDEVFLSLPKDMETPTKLVQDCTKMGVVLHMELATLHYIKGQKQIVERIGNCAVVSTCVNIASSRQLFFKRAMDICGALVGCLVTGILALFIGPIIYLKSPGSIFFSQIRVGRNGKKFKLYKFRSMYPDAEARKAELMERNKIKDGMMFKMEHDPRIIGGEKGKGIGNFIRNTSIDEWPQFWNVLKGEMSLVGTRPPTVDEWEKYELHHRARLSIKPGITGMWQVSGRSNITDFERVVELDTEYIENWSFGLDMKILFKTVQVVLLGKGAS